MKMTEEILNKLNSNAGEYARIKNAIQKLQEELETIGEETIDIMTTYGVVKVGDLILCEPKKVYSKDTVSYLVSINKTEYLKYTLDTKKVNEGIKTGDLDRNRMEGFKDTNGKYTLMYKPAKVTEKTESK